MHVIQNRALLIKTKYPERITTIIPKSKILKEEGGRAAVLVNLGLEEVQVLRNIGYKEAPPPILYRYNWPGMFKPFDHQRTTAAFLTLNRRSFCFNDPGTGKTAAIAWAADYLIKLKLIRRVLVICPMSIMSAAWRTDLFKTLMHRRVDIAHGDRKKRAAVIASDAEFVIINFDGVEIVTKELIDGGFDLIVIDEANYIKTHTTKRWKAINAIINPSTWVWAATGTPAAQSPTDAYGLARMLSASSVPHNFYSFRDKVMYKISNFTWKPKENAQDIVHKALQPAIRFTKEECLDLPELLYSSRDVPLTMQQKKYYDMMKEQFVMQAAGETTTAVNAATNLNKLLQISSGAVYTDDGKIVEFDIKARYDELKDIIQESTHKVLIFVPFKHAINVLEEKLVADGYTVGVIQGDVSAGKRTDIFSAFQNTPNPHVLIIQPQAASHGVTLHAANTVVWWGPVTSNETYHQANARVHRAGQKNPCLVVHLVGSSVERKLYRALESKSKDLDSLLSLYEGVLEE